MGLAISKIFLFILLSISFFNTYAEGIYQKPADFINESFSSKPPKSSVLWITKSLKPAIYKIMGHDLGVLRIRYWEKNGRTVWVLNEIGKEHPITVGLVVKHNKIQQYSISIFNKHYRLNRSNNLQL